MRFSIAPLIFEKFPKLCVGVVVVKDVDNKGSDEKIHKLLEEIEDYIKLNFTLADVAKHELISPWKTVYEEFGIKPASYHSSVEALMKRILNGKRVPRVNKLVDISNYVSLKYIVPVGVFDLDEVDVYINLGEADGTEQFFPIGTVKMQHPKKGEIVYKDDSQVLCRRWNWKESEKTKVREETRNAIFFVDGLPPLTKKKVLEIVKDIAGLVEMFCGGKISYYVLDSSNREIEF